MNSFKYLSFKYISIKYLFLKEFNLGSCDHFIIPLIRRRQWHPTPVLLPGKSPMDVGAWWAAVRGVANSQTRLSDFTFSTHSASSSPDVHSPHLQSQTSLQPCPQPHMSCPPQGLRGTLAFTQAGLFCSHRLFSVPGMLFLPSDFSEKYCASHSAQKE